MGNALLSKAIRPQQHQPDTHSAVHSGDGRSEDPILKGLLNRTSGDSAIQQVKESNFEERVVFWVIHTAANLLSVNAAGHLPCSGRHTNISEALTCNQAAVTFQGFPKEEQSAFKRQMLLKNTARETESKYITEQSTKPSSCQENPPPFFFFFF